MQPTVSAWVSWYRRARARDSLRPDAHARPRNRIAVYTFGRDHPTTLIRLNTMLGSKHGATPPSEPWRGNYALDPDAWQVPVMPVGIKRHYQYEPISIVLPAGRDLLPAGRDADPRDAGGAVAGGEGGGWGGAARGWGAGALLLALLLLLVRSAEKCLHKKLFSHRNHTTTTERRDPESLPSDLTIEPSIDLPPPYSECANTGPNIEPSTDASKPHTMEEPPPPYSACYVTYSTPKDGTPSVQFYNSSRRRPDEPGSSQNETNNRSDTELVFDNGRILEGEERKDSSDVPIHGSDTSNNSNSTENTRRDTVILV